MADIAAHPDLRDPLGTPHIATGPEYLDALAHLGYNAENLSSPMPFAAATARAASSLITNQYDQAMNWQKAQAEIALSMAHAKNYDSETQYNNESLQTRLRTLDLTNQYYELRNQSEKNQLAVSSATIEDAIRQSHLKTQTDQDNFNDLQRRRAESIEAQSDSDPAIAALTAIKPDDPDFEAKYHQAFIDHNKYATDPATRDRWNSYVTELRNQRAGLAVAARHTYNVGALQGFLTTGDLPSSVASELDSAADKPKRFHELNTQGNLTRTNREISNILHTLQIQEPTPDATVQGYITALTNAQNYINSVLVKENPANEMARGEHSQWFDADGRLNNELRGDLDSLKAESDRVKSLEKKEKDQIVLYGDVDPRLAAFGGKADQRTITIEPGTPPDQVRRMIQDAREQLKHPQEKAAEDRNKKLNEKMIQQSQQEMTARWWAGPPGTGERGFYDWITGARPAEQTQEDVARNRLVDRLNVLRRSDPAVEELARKARTGSEEEKAQARAELWRRIAAQERPPEIEAQQRQTGGIIFDPRTAAGSTDTVPAMLSPGEYVVSAPAVAAVGQGTLDQINQTGRQISASPNIKNPLGDISPTAFIPKQQAPATGKTEPAKPDSKSITPWWGDSKSITPWWGSTGDKSQEPKSVSEPSTSPQSILPEAAAAVTAAASARTPSQVEPTSPIGGGWNTGRGTEFGEVDNPVYGGYTEAGWNKGAWGDTLSGWDTEGVALPNVPHGTVVEIRNPKTGATTTTTVKDKGPGPGTGAAIDLLGGTRARLGFARNFSGPVQYRILSAPSGYQHGGPVTDTNGSVTTGPAAILDSPVMTGMATNFGHDLNGNPDKYMLSKLGAGSQIGAFGHDVTNPNTAGVSLPAQTIRQYIGDPSDLQVHGSIKSGRYQVEVSTPSGVTKRFPIVDIGPGAKEPGKIDITGSAMRQLGVKDNFNASYRIVDTGAQTYQHGGLVSEEGSIGTRGARGGTGGGIESQLDAPVDPKQRHRRFHPRVGAAGQLGAIGADIPDAMQKKLAKLSQGYLSGLSDLISQSPEMGPALLRHARNQLAANMGSEPSAGGEEQQQMRQAAPQIPPEAYAGGGEGGVYMQEGGSVTDDRRHRIGSRPVRGVEPIYGPRPITGPEKIYGAEPIYGPAPIELQRGGQVVARGYQAGGAVMPEDVMNRAMLDPESMGLGYMQRGGLVRPNRMSNLLSRAY